jgi:RecA/RadA recombinase
MPPPLAALPRALALDDLKAALAGGHREASAAAFVPSGARLLATHLPEVDRALGGGFVRGAIATLEGAAGSGRSALLARLLAESTAHGLAALIERPQGAEGRLYPPSLAAAGVRLERLLIVHADDELGVARAADIVLRSATCGVVAIPAVRLSVPVWTRLASLAHRADALLVALGTVTAELRYFASLRLELQLSGVHWSNGSGLFGTLAGIETHATVLKHKRAVPGKQATFACTTFERRGAPIVASTPYLLARPQARLLARGAHATS